MGQLRLHRPGLQQHGTPQRLLEALANQQGTAFAGIRQQQPEVGLALASQQIVVAAAGCHAIAQGPEQRLSSLGAELLAGHLQLRQVNDHHRQALVEQLGALALAVQVLMQGAAADRFALFVEGIGGLRVPLAGGKEVIDLVADLECEAIVVARSGLGTLNHTALSVDALEARGIDVRTIVLNEYEGATVAERTNPRELESMTGLPVETVSPLADLERGTILEAVGERLSSRLEV